MDEKKSFVMYDSWATLLFNLPTEQAGELIKAICGFQLDKGYEIKDPTVIAMYAMVKPQMIKDAANYEEVKKQRSEYGKLGAQKRWKDSQAIKQDGNTIAKDSHPIANDSQAIKQDGKRWQTMPVYDSVSVYVSPNGDIKEKNTKKENPLDESEPPGEGISVSDKPFDDFWLMYPKHNAKKAAMGAWQTATIGTNPNIIMAGLKKVIDLQWSKWPKEKQDKFIPNAVNWLKGERWKDEIQPYEPETHGQTVIHPPERHKQMSQGEFDEIMGWKKHNGDN